MTNKLNQFLRVLSQLLRSQRQIDEIKMNQGRMLALLQHDRRHESLNDYEFKVFSQWGEDGIIQHLVAHLQIPNRTFIEFGVEDFHESNCRFLLMNNHWRGFVVDGSERNMQRLRGSYFYWQHQLNSLSAFITRENIHALLTQSGFERELGILSVDLDGIDYYVLEALGEWQPAILIVEYNEAFGFEHAVTVPYDPAFQRIKAHFSNQYWGASLPAFRHLAEQRGYTLVGVNGAGSNAFFVRRSLLNDRVKEASVESCRRPACFRDSRDEQGKLTFLSGTDRLRAMHELPLVDVITGRTIHVRDLSRS